MRTSLVLLGAAMLAACDGSGPVADDAENTDSLPTVNVPDASPTGGRPDSANAVNSATAGRPASAIPAALHGRWGLTPADCMAPAGQGTGLLTIGPNELRFHESVAVPGPHVLTSGNSVGGDFNFTGEGQSWSKYQSLEVEDGRLTRTERNPIASFRYVRCD